MKRIMFLFSCIALNVAWSPQGFAQSQTAVGSGVIPLDATGIKNGVSMSASGTTGTLSVGVPGGPETDIFTSNDPPVAGQLAVSTAASSQGNIVFNSSSTVFGGIGMTQPGGPFLRDISGGNAGDTVNFLGPVFATSTTVSGTGTLNFNSGSTNITATNFAGDGTINLAPNTTVIGAMTTTAGADTGTLSLGSGSVLNGAVGGAVGLKSINVTGGSDTSGVSATITGAVDAYTFNLGTNTLNIGGALTIANVGPSGIVNTTLASPSVYGNIRPVGATNLGPTIRVNVTVPSSALIPVGTQFNIIQTQTGTVQSGTNGSVVSVNVVDPTNPLYTFEAVPAAGTIAGEVTIRVTGIPLLVPVQPPAGVPLPVVEPIAAAVVHALLAVTPDTLAASPNSDLVSAVLPAINALSNPAAVVNAVAQLAPSAPDLAAPLVNFEGSREFQNLWMSRLNNTFCGQLRQLGDQSDRQTNECGVNHARSGWWMKGFGYVGNQGSQGVYNGYNSRIIGTMIAYDALINHNTRVGVGVGYARSMIDGNTSSAGATDVGFNTYQATAYIGHKQGSWFVYGDASFGWNAYSSSRNIVFPGLDRTAQSNYNGQDYTAYAVTGYHFYTHRLAVTPIVSLQYNHMNLGSYTETGAGDINLNVKSRSYDFLESAIGVKVARPFRYNRDNYVPEVHFNWFHELINPTLKDTASFTSLGSPSFTTPGLDSADNTINVGTGLTLLSCDCKARTWSLEAVYDYYWRNDRYSANQGMMRFTARF